MNYRVVLFLLLKVGLCSVGIVAQNKPLADSLKNVLKYCKNDSNKIQLLLQLAKSDFPINGLIYSKQALEIAKHNNYIYKEALAFERISICQRKLGNNAEAIEASLKALSIYEEFKQYKKTAAMQLQIGSHFTNDKNFIEGIKYMKLAIESFKVQNEKSRLAYALINLGETYRLMQIPDSAISCFKECLQLNKELNLYY